jgi:hypothetical protein
MHKIEVLISCLPVVHQLCVYMKLFLSAKDKFDGMWDPILLPISPVLKPFTCRESPSSAIPYRIRGRFGVKEVDRHEGRSRR